MLISKKWLQTYFDQELPSMQKISDTLLLHSFEIEGLEEKDGDWILDIDVLPNRAHDCLCYEGIAAEVSGLLNIPMKEQRYSNDEIFPTSFNKTFVAVLNTDQCTRYIATLVENIEVRESPDWLVGRLSAMGQKSINALVDATNYVMFDMGQPLHVFDADKVVGGITVRNAEEGETMKTLSGEELELVEGDLVICDNDGILALAGVKGGVKAEVDEHTKNIIVESAHFNGTTTRTTARRVKILTDASKRYENHISAEKAAQASLCMLSLILELAGTENTMIAESTDVYPNKKSVRQVHLTQDKTARLLGFDISMQDISDILDRFKYSYTQNNKAFDVVIPSNRLDLSIEEDLIEEIGRLYGYHMIPVKKLDDVSFEPRVNKHFYVEHLLKNYFVKEGFTEIMNYSFVKKGDISLLNPLASDKKYLRKNLSKQMKDSIEKNARLADFVNMDQVLHFEIDRAHTESGEHYTCCFAIDTLSKKSRKRYGNEDEQIKKHIQSIEKMFGLDSLVYTQDAHVISFDLEQCFTALEEEQYADLLEMQSYVQEARFVGISSYPYMKRDISFWTEGHSIESLKKAIADSGAEFLQKVFLFDEFEKEGRVSYAFSMIFQSFDRTLTDADVDQDMLKINQVVESLGGEIR